MEEPGTSLRPKLRAYNGETPAFHARASGQRDKAQPSGQGEASWENPPGWRGRWGSRRDRSICLLPLVVLSRDLWRKTVMWGEEFQNPPTVYILWVAAYIYQWIRKIMCIAKIKKRKKEEEEEISYCECTDLKGRVWWVWASGHVRVTTSLIEMYISMTPECSLRPLSRDSPPEVTQVLSWFLTPQPSLLCSRTPNTLNHADCIRL